MKIRQEIYKIILLGNTRVGKTSLAQYWRESKIPDKYKKTIGVEPYTETVEVEDAVIRLQLWDVAGEERFEPHVIDCYQRTDAVFLLYDVTAPQTLLDINNWLSHIKRNMDKKYYQQSVVVLVGNKADHRSKVSVAQLEAMQEKIKKELKLAYIPEHASISVKTGKNVEQLFVDVTKKLLITAPSIEDYPIFNDPPDESSSPAISFPIFVSVGCAAIICMATMFLWPSIIALSAGMLALLAVGAVIFIAASVFAALQLTQYCQASAGDIDKENDNKSSSTLLLKNFGKNELEKTDKEGSKPRKFNSFEMEEKSSASSFSPGLIVSNSDENERKFII